ncbi:hypothetical protein [Streptomyces sp. WMMC905]|uniref:hypothetical protein n=2 Tax=unclassified Streptomyces TaxID=2593676 RepID=UPI003B950359
MMYDTELQDRVDMSTDLHEEDTGVFRPTGTKPVTATPAGIAVGALLTLHVTAIVYAAVG